MVNARLTERVVEFWPLWWVQLGVAYARLAWCCRLFTVHVITTTTHNLWCIWTSVEKDLSHTVSGLVHSLMYCFQYARRHYSKYISTSTQTLRCHRVSSVDKSTTLHIICYSPSKTRLGRPLDKCFCRLTFYCPEDRRPNLLPFRSEINAFIYGHLMRPKWNI